MKEKYVAKVGDYVVPDQWTFGENLKQSDGYHDSSFPGCQFRLPSCNGYELAVNVKITGKNHISNITSFMYKCRCRIEFVRDGEPSEFTCGWLYHN